MILTLLQKLPKNGEDWGKLIVARSFKKLAKFQNIAQSGHTEQDWAIRKVESYKKQKVIKQKDLL